MLKATFAFVVNIERFIPSVEILDLGLIVFQKILHRK